MSYSNLLTVVHLHVTVYVIIVYFVLMTNLVIWFERLNKCIFFKRMTAYLPPKISHSPPASSSGARCAFVRVCMSNFVE